MWWARFTPLARRCARPFWALALAGMLATAATRATPGELRGLPFIRSYSYEEIGDVSRGARLNFDRFGRLAVIHRGAYVVLNDGTWIELASRSEGDRSTLDVVQGPDGAWYYGALGGWGVAEITAEGKLRQQPLVPAEKPDWVSSSSFATIIATRDGMYFGGWNGVVYYNPRTRRQTFTAVPGLVCMFAVNDRIYVSSNRYALQEIDGPAAEARTLTFPDAGIPERATDFDATHALVSTNSGLMFLFDGTTFTPWTPAISMDPDNRVSAMLKLLDGSLALGVAGRGLYIVAPDGHIITALTAAEYQRVINLATHEAGVLWVATEMGVDKILYGTPVTIFGQRLGLAVSWPQVVRWHDSVLVASAGRLYVAVPGVNGNAAHFQIVPHQPGPAVWGLAAHDDQLLVGTSLGVFTGQPDGTFRQILSMDVARLVMVGGDLCYAIGADHIGVLRFVNGEWREAAPHIPGLGYPSVVHAFGGSAWIELGLNRAARISYRDGRLQSRVFESFPWPEPNWINLGMVGHTVIMSGTNGKRVYFDEDREMLAAAPELDALLKDAPFPLSRIDTDSHGLLWATHERGIFTIARNAESGRFASAPFEVIDDRTPMVSILPDDDVWVSTGQSLYHVDRTVLKAPHRDLQPRLIAVTDARTSAELAPAPEHSGDVLIMPYEQNNLALRFFAGGYDYRRAPTYEYKFDPNGEWTSAGNGSRLALPGLREGRYHVAVRLNDTRGPVGTPLGVDIEIRPPWYRTWYALAGMVVALCVGLLGLIKWSIHRADRRNFELEELVRKRTNELKATMDKLNEETRHTATLAERHRLAGEIHDSVQQGLSGLMLQLDATLKLTPLPEAIRSRLSVARNMVSFTRHEVQQAVWNLESPLLEDTELGDALQKLARLISPGIAEIEVLVSGTPRPLTPTVKHDLLRIAQEALTNAVRHAEPTHVTLRLTYDVDDVELTVTDDGKGFDPAAVLSHGIGHFGLRGLRGRAQKIGGHLDIESTPGLGTCIKVRVATHEQRVPRHPHNAPV